MKSLALSLLVALGVSLGTVTAFADSGRTGSLLETAAATSHQAQVHAQRAAEYRLAARVASEKARVALQVMENDLKQGFVYEAGIMRQKAAAYQQEAQSNLALAAREDAIAAQLRAQAKREMQQYQQMIGMGSTARR